MANKKRKFSIKLQPNNEPIHLQGLTMWSSSVPVCPTCKTDAYVEWENGEYLCFRCGKTVER